MANIRKTFNFRNGVQVDDDNLIVNPLGLVGVGTTVPTESLDVRGNLKVVGSINATDITTNSISVGVITATTVVATAFSGGRVSIVSGIVTASSGVVTYYGDGGQLLNLPTSQWLDIDVGLGFTSIYARGFVGVSTNDPRYAFQVGGTNNLGTFASGVGIDSTGNIRATGIITASKFVGIGSDLTLLNASNISSGTIGTDRIPTLRTDQLPSNITVSGIITASSGFSGNLTGNITGNLTGNVTGNLTGNVTGIASTARTLTGSPDISVSNITAIGIAASTSFTIGVSTSATVHIGLGGTAISLLSSARLGIGTTTPTTDIQILKDNNVEVQFISRGGVSQISIGQTINPPVGAALSVGLIRYGNSPKSFDIANNDSGDINLYLHAGPAGINTGRFKWIYGQTFQELMSLSYDGYLGIGITNPSHKLHVVGTSTVTSDSYVGGNLNVSGTINGSITLPNPAPVNINSSTGISTTYDLQVQNKLTAFSIGIGTTNPIVGLDARQKAALFGVVAINTTSVNASLQVTGESLFDTVGIGTTTTGGESLVISDSSILISDSVFNTNSAFAVGIGTTLARSVIDLADAGNNLDFASVRFMLPPTVTTTERAGLSTIAGAFIFNKTTNKFQGYTGIAWTDFH
jgi:hypothetical protein